MDTLEQGVRQQVARYLNQESALRDLYEWLGPVAWNIEARASAEVSRLVREVELYLEEFQHGDWTEDELRGHLRGVLRVIATEPGRYRLEAASSSPVVWFPIATRLGPSTASLRWQDADTRAGTAGA